VHDDGTLILDLDGEVLQLWNHQPGLLAVLAARNDNAITLHRRWRILRTASDGGAYVFSLATVGEAMPCPGLVPA